jgi:hypothetical protein
VQDDVVEFTPAECEGLGTERHDRQADVLVEVRVQIEQLILAHRPVVAEDQLAVPEPSHDLGEVLHLRGGDRRHAERPVHGRDPATDAESEAALRQAMHGGGPRSGDQWMACVVIGCGGGDLHAAGDRAGGTDQRRRLLDVPPLGDERRAEAQLLTASRLVHQTCRALASCAGQEVVAQLVQHPVRHSQAPIQKSLL